MIYVIALLILFMPILKESEAGLFYFLLTATWFCARFGYELWLWARHRPRRLPALSWLCFCVFMLAFGAFWTARSVCPSESMRAYSLLMANVLLFITLFTVRRHPGPYPTVLLGFIGLVGIVLMNHGIDLGTLHDRLLARWVAGNLLFEEHLLGLAGLIFIPSLLLMLMADMTIIPPRCKDLPRRKRHFFILGRQIVFLLFFTFWCGFLTYVALGKHGWVILLLLPSLAIFMWRLLANRHEEIMAKPGIIAVAVFAAIVSIYFIASNVCQRPELQSLLRCHFTSLGIEQPGVAVLRAATEHINSPTGLGTSGMVSKGFARVGDWGGAKGGSFPAMTIELGWGSTLVTGLLFTFSFGVIILKMIHLGERKSGSTVVFLGGSLTMICGLVFVDSRLHLLLSPMFWLVFALLASLPVEDAALANNRLARFIKKNRGLWVGLKSFLLSIIVFALIYNGYQVLRRQISDSYVKEATELMQSAPENQRRILELLIRASWWNPKDADIDYLVGKLLVDAHEQSQELKAHKRSRAEEMLRKALSKCSLNPDYHGLLGQILFLDGNMNGALREYQESVRIDPLNAQWRNELAGLYETMGELETAERELRILCDIEPYSGMARYDLARVLERQGRIREAMAVYKAAFQVEPDFLPARRRYAILRGLE